MLDSNSVNAEVEEVVTPQDTGVEVVESVQSEVATEQPTEKPVQSKEDNAKYAEIRREAERKAQDKLISEMYGASHGIHTKAEYDRIVREQQIQAMKEDDADPVEIYSKLKATDPEFQELQQIKNEIYTNKQIAELNADLKDIGIDFEVKGLDDLATLPNSEAIVKHIEKGKTLSEAYFLANKKDIINGQSKKIQQDTIKKIQANGNTPGSLADNGQTTALYTKDQVDNMSMEDIQKNYDLVMKSAKTWK
jgi:hypothetical protein